MLPTTTKHCLYFPTTTQMSIAPAFILTISTRKWLKKDNLSRSPLSLANHAHSTTQPSTPSQKGVARVCIGNEPRSHTLSSSSQNFPFCFCLAPYSFFIRTNPASCVWLYANQPPSLLLLAGPFVGVCETLWQDNICVRAVYQCRRAGVVDVFVQQRMPPTTVGRRSRHCGLQHRSTTAPDESLAQHRELSCCTDWMLRAQFCCVQGGQMGWKASRPNNRLGGCLINNKNK